MSFGFAQKVITPSIPCKLAGYAVTRNAEAVHDDLYVKVFVFQHDQKRYAIAAYDLLAVDHLLMNRVKERCKQSGLHFSRLTFSAIHTHSGPSGIIDSNHGFLKAAKSLLGEVNQAYIEYLCEQTLCALGEAVSELSEGSVKIAFGACEGIGSNRNDAELAGDPSLWIMEARHEDKKALIVNFACHPTILKADNRYISSDFCGAFADAMEPEGYTMCMYLNGSCGDISSRFTRCGSNFQEVKRMGDKLAQAVKQLRSSVAPFELHTLVHTTLSLTLKGRVPQSIDSAKTMVEKRKAELEQGKARGLSTQEIRLLENAVEGAAADYLFALHDEGIREYPLNVEMLKLNDEIFIGFPGELFSQLSNPYVDAHTHFISYTNGYQMYIADADAYDKHYYEAASSPFAKGEGERLMKEIVEQIKKWRNQK